MTQNPLERNILLLRTPTELVIRVLCVPADSHLFLHSPDRADQYPPPKHLCCPPRLCHPPGRVGLEAALPCCMAPDDLNRHQSCKVMPVGSPVLTTLRVPFCWQVPQLRPCSVFASPRQLILSHACRDPDLSLPMNLEPRELLRVKVRPRSNTATTSPTGANHRAKQGPDSLTTRVPQEAPRPFHGPISLPLLSLVHGDGLADAETPCVQNHWG